MTQSDRQLSVPLAEAQATRTFQALETSVSAVVAAAPSTIRLAVACLAGGGHLLVEDHPGLGKTTLAKALAARWDSSFIDFSAPPTFFPPTWSGLPCSGPTAWLRCSALDPSSPTS